MFILKSVSVDSDWSMVHDSRHSHLVQFPYALGFTKPKYSHIRCTPWSVFQDGVILSISFMILSGRVPEGLDGHFGNSLALICDRET
jgi:hypothetical protein